MHAHPVTPALVEVGSLRVASTLRDFVAEELLPGTGVSATQFWDGVAACVRALGPTQRALLEERARLQRSIDDWLLTPRPSPVEQAEFLRSIGYLEPEGDPFQITTAGVDVEISELAGPQLVVPATNARFVLNAANARWGSLYDALYGTDVLGAPPAPGPYDPGRGESVIRWVRDFLDDVVPLSGASHHDVTQYRVRAGTLEARSDAGWHTLGPGADLVGWNSTDDEPRSVVLSHHGLMIELRIDRESSVGSLDRAGLSDVVIESALTAIVDLEDSVATVDAQDKVVAYRNWLGLMRGDLVADVVKGDTSSVRRLEPDVTVMTTGGTRTLQRGALLLCRIVGHLMVAPYVVDEHGAPIPEGTLDAFVTAAAALHDRARPADQRNSPAGSVYIVKPKLHGADEVRLTVDTFARVEDVLGLPRDTLKIGIMDEERRTSLNLTECIRAARSRVVFINTGFLDRTGDEIHTCRLGGPMVRKADMRTLPWLQAYEDRNVLIGLACGFRGRAQIGKGMWPAPDAMSALMIQKVQHPRAGASCAWVPSPTAATLHATHYHRIDVARRQAELLGTPAPPPDALLAPPWIPGPEWTDHERRDELDTNVQSILGYVVRWVDSGVGCSKVPDLAGTALMEDRATCRISSQHIANWLLHGVVTEHDVLASFARVATIVDEQNAAEPGYVPMAPSLDGEAFRVGVRLALEGAVQPSGYTEPLLHGARLRVKAAQRARGTA